MKPVLTGSLLLSKRIETILSKRTRPITYERLVELIHQRYKIRYRRNAKPIIDALYDVLKRDALAGNPLKCSLVVREDTGLPGIGFFQAARIVGYQFDDDQLFWKKMMTQLNR